MIWFAAQKVLFCTKNDLRFIPHFVGSNGHRPHWRFLRVQSGSVRWQTLHLVVFDTAILYPDHTQKQDLYNRLENRLRGALFSHKTNSSLSDRCPWLSFYEVPTKNSAINPTPTRSSTALIPQWSIGS